MRRPGRTEYAAAQFAVAAVVRVSFAAAVGGSLVAYGVAADRS